MLKSLGLHVTNPVVPQISGSKSLSANTSPSERQSEAVENRGLTNQIWPAAGCPDDLQKVLRGRGSCNERWLTSFSIYFAACVCSSKAARKMWLGHFTLGNGAYRAQEEESNSVIRGNSRKTRNWFYFRPSLSRRRRSSSSGECLRKCESLESAFGEM